MNQPPGYPPGGPQYPGQPGAFPQQGQPQQGQVPQQGQKFQGTQLMPGAPQQPGAPYGQQPGYGQPAPQYGQVNPQAMIHLTEKPVALAARALEYSSRPGENVLDLFGGSGSTLIAAEQAGRRAFLMEVDALYCDVIVQRWQRFTGRQAQRPGKLAA